MACRSEAVTGSVAKVMLDLRGVGYLLSAPVLPLQDQKRSVCAAYLVSSMGSAISRMHGCLNLDSDEACFLAC